MNAETTQATGAAFIELRSVAIARGGDDGWSRVLAALDDPKRAAAVTADATAWFPDATFCALVNVTEETLGEGFARALGVARADAMLTGDTEYAGDPLRFLKIGAAAFYRDRANYGAASLEITGSKAVVRLVVPEHFTLKRGDATNRCPDLALGFLERAIEIYGGEPHPGRYAGQAPRAESRFDQPMYNLLFEFDLGT